MESVGLSNLEILVMTWIEGREPDCGLKFSSRGVVWSLSDICFSFHGTSFTIIFLPTELWKNKDQRFHFFYILSFHFLSYSFIYMGYV